MNKITDMPLLLILVTVTCLNWGSLVDATSGTTTSDEGPLIIRPQSNSIFYPTNSPIENSSRSQQQTSVHGNQQASLPPEKKSPLPSPFIIAASIVALVEVFGLILSLCLRKRCKKEALEASSRSYGVLIKNRLLVCFSKKSRKLVILCTL